MMRIRHNRNVLSAARHGMRWTSSLAAAAVLSGCMVGPDYVAQNVQLKPIAKATQAGADNKREADIEQWWKEFDDPMLSEIVRDVLAQNLDLAAALARVEQARAAAAFAGAQLLPTVDANASATAEHQSVVGPEGSLARNFPGYGRDQKEYAVGAAASWEIDVAGGLRRNAGAGRLEYEAAEADKAGTRVTVLADAADAYVQVRGLQARLAVAEDQIRTEQHLLDLVKARKAAGAATEREVAQADALLRQARTLPPALKTALEAQLNRLDVLLGVQPHTYAAKLAIPSPIPAVPGSSFTATPGELLRRRPDILAAERRLAAANERIGAAIADYYPKVSLSGVLGFDSLSADKLFTAQAFQPLITAGLRWRLFDFGKVDAEVAAAKGRNAEAIAQYRLTVLHAVEDVENAFVGLSQSQLRASELEAEVTSLQRARDLSETAYQSGAITLTDVLDADRQLLSARDDLDATRADAARAAVGAYRALGGGWSADDSALATAPGLSAPQTTAR
ncbi:NodT family efflux transporter outer membrane factor (OMF) lipoprotein [Paraburkholderia strydomiana]|nr:TolC family protein [Paraburkholderia strydomiana]MDR7009337.1 NodT family efflux transporter outer membrane factor (OMF) lipoprotein [Paraburkholderia strydomiana]